MSASRILSERHLAIFVSKKSKPLGSDHFPSEGVGGGAGVGR